MKLKELERNEEQAKAKFDELRNKEQEEQETLNQATEAEERKAAVDEGLEDPRYIMEGDLQDGDENNKNDDLDLFRVNHSKRLFYDEYGA